MNLIKKLKFYSVKTISIYCNNFDFCGLGRFPVTTVTGMITRRPVVTGNRSRPQKIEIVTVYYQQILFKITLSVY